MAEPSSDLGPWGTGHPAEDGQSATLGLYVKLEPHDPASQNGPFPIRVAIEGGESDDVVFFVSTQDYLKSRSLEIGSGVHSMHVSGPTGNLTRTFDFPKERWAVVTFDPGATGEEKLSLEFYTREPGFG